MYAVIKTGGKQYRVAADEVVTVEKLAGDAGAKVEFTEVLMLGGNGVASRMMARAASGVWGRSSRLCANISSNMSFMSLRG